MLGVSNMCYYITDVTSYSHLYIASYSLYQRNRKEICPPSPLSPWQVSINTFLIHTFLAARTPDTAAGPKESSAK